MKLLGYGLDRSLPPLTLEKLPNIIFHNINFKCVSGSRFKTWEKDTSDHQNCEKGHFYRAKENVTSVSKKIVLSRRILNFSIAVLEREKGTSVYHITVSFIPPERSLVSRESFKRKFH